MGVSGGRVAGGGGPPPLLVDFKVPPLAAAPAKMGRPDKVGAQGAPELVLAVGGRGDAAPAPPIVRQGAAQVGQAGVGAGVGQGKSRLPTTLAAPPPATPAAALAEALALQAQQGFVLLAQAGVVLAEPAVDEGVGPGGGPVFDQERALALRNEQRG